MIGHSPAGVALTGDKLEAIVVTWDKDFDRLVKRVPDGNKTAFRKLGRITFKCPEPQGVDLLKRWIQIIEVHYATALEQSDIRMIITVQQSGLKLMQSRS